MSEQAPSEQAPSEQAPDEHPGLTGAASGGIDAERDAPIDDLADDPQTRPAAEDAADDEFVRENAATSLDQPSDDIG